MDKYDIAIEYLKKNPDKIYYSWMHALGEGGCLFIQISHSGLKEYADNPINELRLDDDKEPDLCSGCLTSIKTFSEGNYYSAIAANRVYDEELTNQIRNDNRIPQLMELINGKGENLEIFAYYQRLADSRYGRR